MPNGGEADFDLGNAHILAMLGPAAEQTGLVLAIAHVSCIFQALLGDEIAGRWPTSQ
jgi:hypothetical protein